MEILAKECLGSSKDTDTVSVQKLCQPYQQMMNSKERFDLNYVYTCTVGRLYVCVYVHMCLDYFSIVSRPSLV